MVAHIFTSILLIGFGIIHLYLNIEKISRIIKNKKIIFANVFTCSSISLIQVNSL